MEAPVEFFPALTQFAWLRHGFVQRVPGVDVHADRTTVLQRLQEAHLASRASLGLEQKIFLLAEQVHGAEVVRVQSGTPFPVPGADGLLTNDPNVCLGLYVADCGAIFLVDRQKKAIGLIHSGKKGTELGILSVAIQKMKDEFDSEPQDLLIQLGPCIRPPFYEIDFAKEIRAQAIAAGVGDYHDCGTCTAAEPEKYYSYRREMGQTGRHLALLALQES